MQNPVKKRIAKLRDEVAQIKEANCLYLQSGRNKLGAAGDHARLGEGGTAVPRGGTGFAEANYLLALSRTLRIRQLHGLGFSTVESTSPLRAIVDYGLVPINFHVVSRAAGPR